MFEKNFSYYCLVILATACSNAPQTVSHQVISENDDIQLTGLINNLEKIIEQAFSHKVRTNRSSFCFDGR